MIRTLKKLEMFQTINMKIVHKQGPESPDLSAGKDNRKKLQSLDKKEKQRLRDGEMKIKLSTKKIKKRSWSWLNSSPQGSDNEKRLREGKQKREKRKPASQPAHCVFDYWSDGKRERESNTRATCPVFRALCCRLFPFLKFFFIVFPKMPLSPIFKFWTFSNSGTFPVFPLPNFSCPIYQCLYHHHRNR